MFLLSRNHLPIYFREGIVQDDDFQVPALAKRFAVALSRSFDALSSNQFYSLASDRRSADVACPVLVGQAG